MRRWRSGEAIVLFEALSKLHKFREEVVVAVHHSDHESFHVLIIKLMRRMSVRATPDSGTADLV
jgi:hypothetical protein